MEDKNVTLIKFAFKTPQNWNSIQIFNQGFSKYVIDHRFNVDWEVLKQADNLGIDLNSLPTIANVLRLVGSHATLWIGPHKGIVAPMDQQPEAWTYPSGQEYEPENFWQWVPSDDSEAKLVSDSNRFSEDPAGVLFGENKSVFKSLVPVQLDRQYGQIQAIEAIPIQRLASLVSKDIDWVFEFEHQT